MFNAHVVEDFISKEDREYLVKTATLSNLWENVGSDFWNGRVINYKKMLKHDKDAAIIMLDANIRCAQKIKELYKIDEIYADTLQLVRWFPGMEQPLHSDDMTDTDIVGYEHRAYGSIIYLNDTYEGGHTYYKNFNHEVTPKAGALAVHPGDSEHLHGVTEIKDGMRYTIASFWTLDKGKSHDWPIS